MRVFELEPRPSDSWYVEAQPRWTLPGVICNGCGETWASVGLSYPTVSLADLADQTPYADGWPVPWERFLELREQIRDRFRPSQLLRPGTGIGPLVGSFKGPICDLTWQHSWNLLCKADAFGRLQAKVADLRGAVPELNTAITAKHGLVEVEIEAHGRLVGEVAHRPEPCSVCQRIGVRRPSRIVLDGSSLNSYLSIFRLEDLTTSIFVTETFLELLTSLSLEGFQATEVDVA